MPKQAKITRYMQAFKKKTTVYEDEHGKVIVTPTGLDRYSKKQTYRVSVNMKKGYHVCCPKYWYRGRGGCWKGCTSDNLLKRIEDGVFLVRVMWDKGEYVHSAWAGELSRKVKGAKTGMTIEELRNKYGGKK